MKIEEIKPRGIVDSAKSLFNQIGDTIAKGTSPVPYTQKVAIAQYPAERNAANDSAQDFRVNDLYKNGLLFTAFQFSKRTTGDLKSFRNKQNTKASWNPLKKSQSILDADHRGSSVLQDAIVNILLPKGQTDVDSVSHKFNDVGESLVSRGNGTVTGALSNVASHAVFGAIESITQGAMADYGEQMYNTARSIYAGAENRTKTYVWQMTPRNVYDLVEIIRIYELFLFYSYGQPAKSKFAKEVRNIVVKQFENIEDKYAGTQGMDKSGTLSKDLADFLTNVNVVSNPVVWTVRNFGETSSFDSRADLFGPAQIQSVRFDKSPDGQFNGLAIAPNLPSTFVLEITMREILTINQDTLFGA